MNPSTQNRKRLIQGLSRAIHHHRLLSRKDVITLMLWVLIIPVCFTHQLFSQTKTVDGFLAISYPLSEQWYVYFLGRSVAWVLASAAMLRMCSLELRPFGKLFFAYCVYGLVMYFINCNSVNYYYIPLIIILIICNKIYS